TVKQKIGYAGLFLYALSERYIGRIDRPIVDDHIRTRGENGFHIGRVAAARQSPECRQSGIWGWDVGPLFRGERGVPAEELFRTEGGHANTGWAAGRKDAFNLFRQFDAPPRGVDHGALVGGNCERVDESLQDHD